MKHNTREVLSVSSEQVEPQEKFWNLLTLKAILINMSLGPCLAKFLPSPS